MAQPTCDAGIASYCERCCHHISCTVLHRQTAAQGACTLQGWSVHVGKGVQPLTVTPPYAANRFARSSLVHEAGSPLMYRLSEGVRPCGQTGSRISSKHTQRSWRRWAQRAQEVRSDSLHANAAG